MIAKKQTLLAILASMVACGCGVAPIGEQPEDPSTIRSQLEHCEEDCVDPVDCGIDAVGLCDDHGPAPAPGRGEVDCDADEGANADAVSVDVHLTRCSHAADWGVAINAPKP